MAYKEITADVNPYTIAKANGPRYGVVKSIEIDNPSASAVTVDIYEYINATGETRYLKTITVAANDHYSEEFKGNEYTFYDELRVKSSVADTTIKITIAWELSS